MSPDAEAQLLAGLNTLNEQVGDLREAVSAVKVNQEAHTSMHEFYARTRSQTCPTEPLVRGCAANIDSLTKIVLDHGTRIGTLEAASAKDEQTSIIITERMRPLKWLMKNLDKVFWAAVAATVIYVLIEH